MYKFRKSSRNVGVSAEIVGTELERIRSDNGGQLTAPDVVAEAQPTKSPLHPAFEWNNKAAAGQYRLHQARNLIKSVVVQMDDSTEARPQFVHIATEKSRGGYYQDGLVAASNLDEFERAFKGAVEKLRGAQRAVEDLQSLASNHGKEDDTALVAVALSALATAHDAVQKVSAH